VAIEIKYFRKKSRWSEFQRAVGQVRDYYKSGQFRRIFLFILDRKYMLSEDDVEELEEDYPWLTVILKR
jgi:hypothetical protein